MTWGLTVLLEKNNNTETKILFLTGTGSNVLVAVTANVIALLFRD